MPSHRRAGTQLPSSAMFIDEQPRGHVRWVAQALLFMISSPTLAPQSADDDDDDHHHHRNKGQQQQPAACHCFHRPFQGSQRPRSVDPLA